jgi:hypothetical protein
MKEIHILITTMTLVICGFLAVSKSHAQEVVHGNDLFVDVDRYIGKEVVLRDGTVFDADNSGFLIKAGSVTFKAYNTGIDRETLRFILNNCSVLPVEKCSVPLFVTVTDQKVMDWPVLINVRLANTK